MPGFSRAVRDQVLVAAARHCAVCHRYKALGVEVHHIAPSAEGGTDAEDNAIALCFDCHAAAGHYNPRHPKGTRYSPDELRLAKAAWKEIVASGVIVSRDDLRQPFLTCRHVVTSDNTALQDMFRLARDQLPFGHFDLVECGPAITHMRECFGQESLFTGYMGRRSYAGVLAEESRPTFRTAAEFHLAHPEFSAREERPLSQSDREFLQRQSVWLRAVQEGTDPAEVGYVLAIGGPQCGDDSWHEEVFFRVPHAVFMQVRNDSDRPIRLRGITAHTTGRIGRVDFRPLDVPSDAASESRVELPPTTILPGHSLLFPEGVFYGPLEDAWFNSDIQDQYAGDIETTSEFKVQSFIYSPDARKTFSVTGPWLHVKALEVDTVSGPQRVEVHGFDPRKPFVSIDTVWMSGSCPHVFFQTVDGRWYYGGEILVAATGPHLSACVSCTVPVDVVLIRIVELEYETTTLDWIKVDGTRIASGVILGRGDSVDVPARVGQIVEIRGHYCSGGAEIPEPTYRTQKHRLLAENLTAINAERSVGRFGSRWQATREVAR